MTDSKKETEDVFEFLESLPQSKSGQIVSPEGSTKDKPEESKANEKGSKQDEDILDFLDELEKSNLSMNKKKPEGSTKEQESPKAVSKGLKKEKASKEAEPQEQQAEGSKDVEAGSPVNDPITSFSKWWSSSGSSTVSNIWNKTTEQASQIKDRLAHDQLDITSKLNTTRLTELARNLQKMVAGETDEVLRIHLVHDLINFPALQYNVEEKFDQVLSSQVQGGIRIFVDQWGHPTKSKEEADASAFNVSSQRKLNIFSGKITDGEKLAFANLDNAIKLFDKAHSEYSKQQKETKTEEELESDSKHKDGISDIFISILPIAIPSSKEASQPGDIVTTDSVRAGNFSFTIILKDITNDVATITRSQGFPIKWVGWLEGSSEWKSRSQDKESSKQLTSKASEQNVQQQAEEEEEEEEDDVDPSDWVKEWVEDGLNLSFGVVAQNYVVERMGF